MNNVYEGPRKAKLIDTIEHQGIGGKIIILEREGTMSFALDAYSGITNNVTIALFNFINRRDDIEELPRDMKLYYGHVGTLGYFVAEDEIDGEIEEVNWSEAREYLR